jgi:SAM-dependent methyltransferase
VEFDWEHRVDTTSATIKGRDRLLGELYSPYQPTEPGLFHQMMSSLKIDFRQFVFIDLGSGKGRALLMAAQYPFQRVVGVELLPSLNRIAQENIACYRPGEPCAIESISGDATEYVFPAAPLVVYLFNPLPEPGLQRVVRNLERSLQDSPRPVLVLYHNPLAERLLVRSEVFRKLGGTHQYSIFGSRAHLTILDG